VSSCSGSFDRLEGTSSRESLYDVEGELGSVISENDLLPEIEVVEKFIYITIALVSQYNLLDLLAIMKNDE